MNSKGISFVETLLSISILFIIAGLLIPLSHNMKSLLYNKKLELHASETAYEAAKIIHNDYKTSGVNVIDDVEYYWFYDGRKICIEFKNLSGERKKCINQQGEV
ncbi:hypothetical protein U5N28_13235 [Lysinibacillus telephonicus]|uniref:Type II secretion system protein n=1 Tax=Lysinibacillus telephonicus TaxID=1714840 RepID=A0A431UIY4_9BACI|nr:hypothetical protein [Lysinibacillus telephonicus]RTQ89531.1 hypothetical protein EKG35_16350 [Lysinibacillus telephonicus]